MSSEKHQQQLFDDQTTNNTTTISSQTHNQPPESIGLEDRRQSLAASSRRRSTAASASTSSSSTQTTSSSSSTSLSRSSAIASLLATKSLSHTSFEQTNQPQQQPSSSSSSSQPINRLVKTRNSPIYFSDSDDVDGGYSPLSPPAHRYACASRFQQQHYRRHRQFHRTLSPDTKLPAASGIAQNTQPIHSPFGSQLAGAVVTAAAAASIVEESTDYDDNNTVRGTAVADESGAANTENNVRRLGTTSSSSSPVHHNQQNRHHRTFGGRRSQSRSPTKRAKAAAVAAVAEVAAAATPRSSTTKQRRAAAVAIERGSMLLNYGPETICVLALILTTFATFQNAPPKLSRLAAPPPFFPTSSLVHDFPAGHLDTVHFRVKSADVSLVFFYAPWSADCQHARIVYEQAARLVYRHVYVAAVNCWQPGGECRGQYPKIHEWPVVMAYYQTGLAVPYTGRWSTASLVTFVRALQRPVQRIHDDDSLLRLMMSHEGVVVAFLENPDDEDSRRRYDVFYATAVKWLERDPFQEIVFAVVTGASVRSFVRSAEPLVRFYQWKGTIEYPDDNVTTASGTAPAANNAVWTQARLHNWLVKQQTKKVTAWLQSPGTKAKTLAPHVRNGPALLLFTPRNAAVSAAPVANDAQDMLRQIALDYGNCKGDQPWVTEMGRVYMTHARRQNRDAYVELRRECKRLKDEADAAVRWEARCLAAGAGMANADGTAEHRVHQTAEQQRVASIVFGSVVNSSKLPSGVRGILQRCTIGPRNLNEMCEAPIDSQQAADRVDAAFDEEEEDYVTVAETTARKMYRTSMLDSSADENAPLNLRKEEMRNICALQAAGEQLTEFPRARFFDVATDWTDFERVAQLGCATNRTLSFVTVDSVLYHGFAEQLGVDVLRMEGETAAIIVDNELESAFVYDAPSITTNGLMEFVYNYTMYKLPRHLKVHSDTVRDRIDRNRTADAPNRAPYTAIELRDINAHTFDDNVINSNKTVFVLYHSIQCALCVPMSHSMLLASHLLADLRSHIDFVRIDSDRNDLPWHYTVDRLPSLIAFPSGPRSVDSRIYPSALAATLPNVLSFVLANLERPLRLHGMVLVCNGTRTKYGFGPDCARTIRTEIIDAIAIGLRQWRRFAHQRGGIVRRLQALQRLLLQLHRTDTSAADLLEMVLAVRKLWPNLEPT